MLLIGVKFLRDDDDDDNDDDDDRMVVEESLKDEAAGSGVSRGERDRGGDSRR